MAQSKSSKRWLREHHDDAFVARARELGYRSRAVFKLDEIQSRDGLLARGQFVLDLGAAPGGWSEYAAGIVGDDGRVLAVDLLAIEPIAGVDFIQGDFTEQAVVERIVARAGERPFDLVMSDMAPNMTGMSSLDQPRAMYLAELALDLAREMLAPGGVFLVKLFQGEGFDDLLTAMRRNFVSVRCRKPRASRSRSNEIYAIGHGLKT